MPGSGSSRGSWRSVRPLPHTQYGRMGRDVGNPLATPQPRGQTKGEGLPSFPISEPQFLQSGKKWEIPFSYPEPSSYEIRWNSVWGTVENETQCKHRKQAQRNHTDSKNYFSAGKFFPVYGLASAVWSALSAGGKAVHAAARGLHHSKHRQPGSYFILMGFICNLATHG